MLSCGMNVTFTTAVSYSVATLSSQSLPNDGENANQPKKFLFLKCYYGMISVTEVCALALSRSVNYKSTLE